MADHDSEQPSESPDVLTMTEHAVIAGFGVPGRAVADLLHEQGTSFCVVEMNDHTVERCRKLGMCIVEGDASDDGVLLKAGIDRAKLFICAIPNDTAMYGAIETARRLNARVRIVARCRYVSSGIEATRRGADDVIVEEQAVAQAFENLLLNKSSSPGGTI